VAWVRASLRGQRVYARALEDGSLAVVGGKVEIRYKPGDGRRYDAVAANLTIEPGPALPDDTCAPAEAVARAEPAAKASASGSKAKAGGRRAAGVGAAPTAARAQALDDAAKGLVIVAYTDGACSGNPGPAGSGVLLVDAKRKIELAEWLGTGTNNIAELTAILRALELADDTSIPLLVHTDSQYAIGVLTKGWKAKANPELIAKIRARLAETPKAELVYVPGHSGVAGNERADELARQAIAARKTTRTEAAAPAPAP
jgi:ribonuclease HI